MIICFENENVGEKIILVFMLRFLKMLRRGKRNRETSVCETRKIELDSEPFTSSFDDGIDSKKTALGEPDDIKSLEKIVLGGEDDFIQKLEKWKQSDSDHSSVYS